MLSIACIINHYGYEIVIDCIIIINYNIVFREISKSPLKIMVTLLSFSRSRKNRHFFLNVEFSPPPVVSGDAFTQKPCEIFTF